MSFRFVPEKHHDLTAQRRVRADQFGEPRRPPTKGAGAQNRAFCTERKADLCPLKGGKVCRSSLLGRGTATQ